MSEEIIDHDDFDRQFRRIEDELDLFDLEFDGIPIWERARAGVSIELLEKVGLTGHVYDDFSGIAHNLRALSLPIRNLVSRNPFLAGESDVLFFGFPRRKRIDGCWWDIYCDPIHEHTDFDYEQVEPEWKFTHYRPARTANLRYLDLITVTSLALKRAGLVRYDPSASERRATERIESRFGSAFDVSIDLETRLRGAIETRRVRKPLYDLLLRKVSPDLVVMIAHSGYETFIEACHDAGVPVAELQHGQISSYSYQHSFPGDRTKFTYPDYLLTFGEFWNGAVDYPIPDDRIISVGYPYLEQELERHADVESGDRIVFVSTPETGVRLSEFAIEAANCPAIEHEIAYKLHPDEYNRWRSDYPWLVDAPLTVVDSNDPSLYDLFARASVQVGVGSTALYEGLAFGLDTYLVDLPTVQWLSPAVERGEATVVESVTEFAALLADSTPGCVPCEKYFEPNAIENVESTLRALLADGTVAESHRR